MFTDNNDELSELKYSVSRSVRCLGNVWGKSSGEFVVKSLRNVFFCVKICIDNIPVQFKYVILT